MRWSSNIMSKSNQSNMKHLHKPYRNSEACACRIWINMNEIFIINWLITTRLVKTNQSKWLYNNDFWKWFAYNLYICTLNKNSGEHFSPFGLVDVLVDYIVNRVIISTWREYQGWLGQKATNEFQDIGCKEFLPN